MVFVFNSFENVIRSCSIFHLMATAKNPNFWEEFLATQRQIPHRFFFLAALSVWLLLFHFLGNSTFGYADTASLLSWMYNAYNNPASEDGHGNLIPFVVLVLFWWKRRELLALPAKLWWPGLFLLAAALFLHLVGYVIQQPRVSIVALFLGIYALIGITWGWQWLKASFFPFVLFVFCIPVGSLVDSVTLPLRVLATNITFHLVHGLFGVSVVKQGTQLFDGNGAYNFDVAAACSGIRSLLALLALTSVFAMLTFRTSWKRLVIVFSAFPLAVGCNVLRLTAVVVAAEAFGQDAGNFVHEWFGFVTYTLALAGVWLLGNLLKERPSPAAFTEANAT